MLAARAVLPFALAHALALALAGAAGCASRSVPDAPAAASAASGFTAETPRASVTAALDSDPPLPGKSDPRWSGLRDPEPGAGHDGHGHHHHAPAGATHAR